MSSEATEPRKPGWYWVKFPAFTYWLTASWKDGRWSCGGYKYYDPDFSVIGPRIPTPDEIAGQHEAQRQRIAQKIENSARLSKNRFAQRLSAT